MGLMLAGAGWAGGALKSGPQVGEQVPGPFHPLNVTGEHAGEKHCLYCEMGPNPVAMIFAREVTPGLTTLIKKVDAETAKNGKKGMGSFVVFLSNQETLEKDLQNLAKKEGIKTTILSIDNPAGPARYAVANDADVTVVLYNEHQVVANHAFRKGQLDDKATGRVVADIPKILK
jgi:hypothetical protein